jgi:integrase
LKLAAEVFSRPLSQGLRIEGQAFGFFLGSSRLNKLTKRERFLSAEAFARLGEAMATLERQVANRSSLAIVRLLTLTGARRTAIASLRWDYVDFERGALRLPDSKTGAKVIPLGAPALDVLAKLPCSAVSAWVFPATRGKGCHLGVPAIWRKLVKLAGLEGGRLHDLRHGFASFAVADGDSLYLVGKAGAYPCIDAQRYAHLQLDPVRAVQMGDFVDAASLAAPKRGSVGPMGSA